jgi:hypothetical protein
MQVKVALAAGLMTVAAYMAWLGWDQRRNPDGTGPYEAWQVIGLALTLTTLAAASSWRSTDIAQSMMVGVIMAAVLTMSASIDWATDQVHDANLWIVGAIYLFAGSTLGLWVVALLTRAAARRTHRH